MTSSVARLASAISAWVNYGYWHAAQHRRDQHKDLGQPGDWPAGEVLTQPSCAQVFR